MPHIPQAVAESQEAQQLIAAGLTRTHQGKVRDTFPALGGRHVLTTDRTSAFDFKLRQGIPDKGKILNAINILWRKKLSDIPNDLLAAGVKVDLYLPAAARGNKEIQSRCVFVEDLDMILAEHVARGILTGSAWKMYREGQRALWGYDPLPDGMKEWDELPQSFYTPTNKAESGHDVPVTRDFIRELYGPEMEDLTISLYDRGRAEALNCGLITVDTKFEFGRSRKNGHLKLGDEVFTPDSSRYLSKIEFAEDRRLGRKPRSFDKQIIRDYLTHAKLPNGGIVDVSKLDPKNVAHRALVATITLPDSVIEQTRARYLELLKMQSGGMSLEEFGREELGITA